MRRAGLFTLLLAALALAATDRAVADLGLYPVGLKVSGGEGAWQAHEAFELSWTQPPIAADLPVAGVGYRVHNGAGEVVVPLTRLQGERTWVKIQLPPRAGVYRAELWLEGMDGERGPARSVFLRYDNARPGPARPVSTEDWIAGSTEAKIAIRPPVVPFPLSGIRGYAVALDRGGEGRPCAALEHCQEDEIDLPFAGEESVLSLGTLPEGLTVVRALAVSGAGIPSAETASALIRVDATPPAVTASGLPSGWSNGPVSLLALATDALSGMAPDGPNGPFTAIAVDGGTPRTEPGERAAVDVRGEGLHRIALYARDAAGNVGDRSTQTATIAIDESPPLVSFVASQDPADPERIEATVSDPLSGADPGRGSVAVRPAGTSRPWEPLPTTVAAGRLVARWRSESSPPGVYEFRAGGYDRAGNRTGSSQRANHTRMVLLNPLKEPVRLEGWLSGTGRTGTVPYGSGAVYRGRLRDADGAPLAGLPVDVVESFEPGAAWPQRASRVLSAADGTFALRLSPGPSRAVAARFAGTRTLTATAGNPVQLAVRARASLRASARVAWVGGAPVVFSGQVGRRGVRLPGGGAPVELQFRIPGGEWAGFRTVHTDPRGRFRYAYAFSDDDSRGVRFRFRACVDGGGWPYEPAASKAVSVTGR